MSETSVGLHGLVRRHRAAAGPAPAACALAFGSVVLVGVNDGGYYDETWRWAAVSFVAVLGISQVRERAALGALDWVSLVAFCGVGLTMLASASWGIDGTEATREAERCALYVAALAAFLVVAKRSGPGPLLFGVVAGVLALVVYGLGQRVVAPPPLDPYQGSLLAEPVGYANALGILAAMGALLGLGLSLDGSSGVRTALLRCSVGVFVAALVLTSSRGAWLAGLVGLGVLAGSRIRWTRRARVAAFPVAALAAFALALAVTHASFGDRPAYWRAAAADVVEHPLLGSGAGSFDDYWLDNRRIDAHVRDAHSLYLETLAELGPVGLVLLLCALGAPLVAAARGSNRTIAGTAACAYAAFLVHAGLDWDWEMPVTTLAGLACGAALLVERSRLGESRAEPPPLSAS